MGYNKVPKGSNVMYVIADRSRSGSGLDSMQIPVCSMVSDSTPVPVIIKYLQKKALRSSS